MSEKLTPWQKVLRYYPQRVQVLIMSALNLAFIVTSEMGLELTTTLVGAVNAFALAALVFFYGEEHTVSHGQVEDWWVEAEIEHADEPA